MCALLEGQTECLIRNIMKTRKKEICGTFLVENEDHQLQQVLVIQDVLSLYKGKERYLKTFRLESINGITVYQTEDPDTFKLANGTILKKRNR